MKVVRNEWTENSKIKLIFLSLYFLLFFRKIQFGFQFTKKVEDKSEIMEFDLEELAYGYPHVCKIIFKYLDNKRRNT